MCPTNPLRYPRYRRSGYSESRGYLIMSIGIESKQPLNLPYLLAGQPGEPIFFAAALAEYVYRMACVTTPRDVFEIIKAVIRLVSVPVVHYLTIGARADKGGSDEPMYAILTLYPRPRQFGEWITPTVYRQVKYPTDLSTLAGRDPLHTAQVANVIDALVSGHIAPFFTFKFFGGKLLISHFTTSFSVLVRRAMGVLAPAALCFIPPNYTPIPPKIKAHVPPGDWTTRREWMTTFNELREVRR